MSDYPDLDKYAIPGLTDEDAERFMAALREVREEPPQGVNVLPLLNLTPLDPLDADPPEPPGKVTVS